MKTEVSFLYFVYRYIYFPYDTQWVSIWYPLGITGKKSDTQFLHCVKPIDGNFTQIWDSLSSHLGVPYFLHKAPILGLNPTPKSRPTLPSLAYLVYSQICLNLPYGWWANFGLHHHKIHNKITGFEYLKHIRMSGLPSSFVPFPREWVTAFSCFWVDDVPLWTTTCPPTWEYLENWCIRCNLTQGCCHNLLLMWGWFCTILYSCGTPPSVTSGWTILYAICICLICLSCFVPLWWKFSHQVHLWTIFIICVDILELKTHYKVVIAAKSLCNLARCPNLFNLC